MKSKVDGWSDSKYKAFIISTLRGGMRRYPNKSKVIKKSSVGKKINKESGRMAEHFECKMCEGHFPRTQIQCDHIYPVVNPKVGFTTWDDYIDRMFCSEDDLQVLCKNCHTQKTKTEIAVRKKIKNPTIKPRNPGKRKKAYAKRYNNSEKCI